MKNNFNLLVLFGVLFTSFGFFCLAIFAQELLDASRYNNQFRWQTIHTFFLGVGAVGVLTGIGLMLRLSWSRLPATLILILSAGAWTLFALSELDNFREVIVMLGFSILIFSTCLFGIFFLNNEYTLRQFGLADHPDEKNDDILDW